MKEAQRVLSNLGAVDNQGDDVPVGTILPFFGTKDQVPDGYLLCAGGNFTRAAYPELYDHLKERGYKGDAHSGVMTEEIGVLPQSPAWVFFYAIQQDKWDKKWASDRKESREARLTELKEVWMRSGREEDEGKYLEARQRNRELDSKDVEALSLHPPDTESYQFIIRAQ